MDIFGNPAESGGFKNPANAVLNMNNYKIINLDTPTDNKDVANKVYVDTAISTGLPPGNSYSDYIYWDNSTSSYKSGGDRIHIGSLAGVSNQSYDSVAIGNAAGANNQTTNCIAIGTMAGYQSQQYNNVAIGTDAGGQNQGETSVAIGFQAGRYNQVGGCLAFGCNAGNSNQGLFATALGFAAGKTDQGQYALALGFNAGEISQPAHSVCIGNNSNCTLQHEVVLGDASCPQVKSAGMFVTDQGFKLSSGGSSTQYFTTDGGVGSPSSSGSSNIYLYNSSTNTDLLTITSGQIRYNNSVQPSANQICISHLTRDNIDIDPFLELVAINNIIYIQDQSTSANYIKYKVIAPPSVSPNNYYIFTVSTLDSQGTGSTNFPNGHDIFMSIYTDTATIDSRLNTLDSEVLALQTGKLSLSGGMMSGAIDLDANNLENVNKITMTGTIDVGFNNTSGYSIFTNLLIGSGNQGLDADQILLGVSNLSNLGSNNTLAIGSNNICDSPFGICVGRQNTHSDAQQFQICIGSNITTSGEGAMAFGRDITNGTKNSLCIGTSNMEWIFPNSSSCALGHPGIHPFKEIYIDGGIIKTGGTNTEFYTCDGTINTTTINAVSTKVSKTGDTMSGNLIMEHDIYTNSRMINGSIYANSNSIALSASGILLSSNITAVGGSNIAITQTNTSILNKIIKVNQAPTTVSAFSDSGYLGAGTFYKGSAGLYVGMGWTFNICFGIGDTNTAVSGGAAGMQVGLCANNTANVWSASLTPDNCTNWFGVGHNYGDSTISFYNKGSTGSGLKNNTGYSTGTPSVLYFSLTMINQFASNDVLLILKEIITNTSLTQTYTMSGTNSVSNTTRLFPVFTRMHNAAAQSGSAIMSFSSMSLTA